MNIPRGFMNGVVPALSVGGLGYVANTVMQGCGSCASQVSSGNVSAGMITLLSVAGLAAWALMRGKK